MAALTLIHMSAEFCGPAYLDGVHGAELVYGKCMDLSVCGAKVAEDIGHFHGMQGIDYAKSRGLTTFTSSFRLRWR